MSGQFKYLFTPFKLGPVTVKNRLCFLPHVTVYSENHLPSERHAYYYAERAKGGVGLIVTGCQMVHPTSNQSNNEYAFDERVIPGYKKITDMVHEHGAKVFGQLTHYGNQGKSYLTLRPLLCPSPVPDLFMREIPKEIEKEEIGEIIKGFGKAARNQKLGGFDGIEIKLAHDGLIRQFLSPYSNRRNDEYGGSLENRMRFALEAVDAVREAIGNDMALGLRFCLDEFIPGGYNLDDAKEMAKRFSNTGKIDYISPSMGTYNPMHIFCAPMGVAPGYAVPACAAIKEIVDIPVFAFGRINTPVQAEKILADGQADIVGMCRQLICDPELPNKAREGRPEDIRACIACNQGCLENVFRLQPSTCVHNPAAGREKELGMDTIKPAAVKKKVVVVGGGPAGMKAAEIAALRGHKVVLYEARSELGGQVNIASKGANRSEIGDVARYLIHQLEKHRVEVKLGVEATPQAVVAENPDAVVIATGCIPLVSDVPGAKQDNVVTAWDVLEGKAKVGENVVVVDEEGFHAATSTAELLADQGKRVEIVTSYPHVGNNIEPDTFGFLYSRLFSKGVTLTPNTAVKEISANGVVVYNAYSNTERVIGDVDTVVLAVGNKANDELYKSLKGKVKELYRVGDCVAPRKLDMAIYEGNEVGRLL
jgi:mycofactocin system FadH/OYE family oxidoreductase 2